MAKANPFRFSTKYQDDESDLLCYGYRYYNASLGRWLNHDPIEEEGGINLYALAGNNPVDDIDALGLWTTAAHERIIDDWLGSKYNGVMQCGCCKIGVHQLLKNASARTDGYTSTRGFHWLLNLNPFSSHNYFHQQSVGTVAQHGMAGPGQSKEDAEEATDESINGDLQDASSAMSDGGAGCKAYKQAIMDIGHAFHAISDSYSPSHSFEHWGGLGKSLITGDAVKHVRRETLKAWLKSSPEFRQEVIDALTSRLLDALDQALSGCRSMDGTK